MNKGVKTTSPVKQEWQESGLVHVSQLKEGFASDLNEVVKMHQHVQVKVVEVDEARKCIQLTMVL